MAAPVLGILVEAWNMFREISTLDFRSQQHTLWSARLGCVFASVELQQKVRVGVDLNQDA